MKKYFLILIVIPIFLSGCFLSKPVATEPVVLNCDMYEPDICPQGCVVCPPCLECSSISCQTALFCQEMGIDKNWYEGIKNQIKNFKECTKAGNAVMESYPRQCKSGEQTFVEDIGNELEKSDVIKLDYPRPNQKITSPLVITGQARGTWFFEATFPVTLYDNLGNVLVTHYATARSNWMTEDFVRFESTLEFSQPKFGFGQLILEKDNPSDLPENSDQLIVPVEF